MKHYFWNSHFDDDDDDDGTSIPQKKFGIYNLNYIIGVYSLFYNANIVNNNEKVVHYIYKPNSLKFYRKMRKKKIFFDYSR